MPARHRWLLTRESGGIPARLHPGASFAAECRRERHDRDNTIPFRPHFRVRRSRLNLYEGLHSWQWQRHDSKRQRPRGYTFPIPGRAPQFAANPFLPRPVLPNERPRWPPAIEMALLHVDVTLVRRASILRRFGLGATTCDLALPEVSIPRPGLRGHRDGSRAEALAPASQGFQVHLGEARKGREPTGSPRCRDRSESAGHQRWRDSLR